MSAAEREAYELLTEAHTFLVLDTETCPAADGGPPRVVSVGTVSVVDGRPGRPKHRLIDPGEPITNTKIHGITDAQVSSAKVKPFADYAPTLTRLMTAANTVLVAHNANYDINVLRGEYARLGLDLPDIPVLDTMRLPAELNIDTGRSRSLASVAAALNIDHKNNHNAADDARTTAKVLTFLLRSAAASGWTDFAELDTRLGTKTTLRLKPPRRRTTPAAAQAPPPEHVEAHLATELPNEPSPDDVQAWLAVAAECVAFRCDGATHRAELAAPHAGLLLAGLVALTADAAEPGQGGTLAGMVTQMLPAAVEQRAVTRWWKRHRAQFAALPRCRTQGMCPSCRNGTACPLDTLHQTVARIACGNPHGPPDEARRLQLMGSGSNKRVPDWAGQGLLDVAGYAAWLAADAYEADGAVQRYDTCVDEAVALGLDQVEPRLALARAARLASQGRFADADAVALGCLTGATTDSGYTDLRNWRDGTLLPMARRAQPPPPRQKTLPRQSRPLSRQRANRYKF